MTHCPSFACESGSEYTQTLFSTGTSTALPLTVKETAVTPSTARPLAMKVPPVVGED